MTISRKICSVAECPNQSKCRGLCQKHYRALMIYGDTGAADRRYEKRRLAPEPMPDHLLHFLERRRQRIRAQENRRRHATRRQSA